MRCILHTTGPACGLSVRPKLWANGFWLLTVPPVTGVVIHFLIAGTKPLLETQL